jgi:molecular chaperone GrpE (heat shock protein)
MFGRIKFRKQNMSGDELCLEDVKNNFGLFGGDGKFPDKKSVLKKVGQIYQFFVEMDMRLIRQDKRLSETIKASQKDLADLQTCFQVAADCQKKTAELVNQNLERYALHPAVLAVDILADIICSIAKQIESLAGSEENPQFTKFIETVLDAARIAELKKDQLGLREIRPKELETLDKDLHEVVKAVATDDMSKHKKTHETVTAGLIYHDKILRQAKVSVYRFSGKVTADSK